MTRLIPLFLTAAALVLTGCGAGNTAATPTNRNAAGTAACDYVRTGDSPARPVDPPAGTASTVGATTLTLTMSGGTVTITGDRSRTPCTLHAMESLATQGYFNDTGCHRLADSGMFMVQCGDPTGTGRGTPGYRFADEIDANTRYPAGTVAMANAGSNTNGSQFFIVYRDTELKPNYTAFGRIDEASLKVIEAMAADGHDNSYGDGTGKPHNPFTIVTATVG
ncbi:MAG: peptidylprolyl isomerase [Micropruina sp.]|uniref:peptidylprolyl isomerase n=1 Tax=Micropruina sp. TaxID=2737536 RepID=UPI0039E5414C